MSGMGKFQQAVRKGNSVDDRLKSLVELKGAQLIGCEFSYEHGRVRVTGRGYEIELSRLPEW
jgi:hypothetical protein